MNKYQKALGSLWSVFKYEPIEKIDEERKENLKFLDTLKELVEKATPMKVEKQENLYDVSDTWICCPNCGKRFEIDYDTYTYCPDCGQALDWSEEE